MIRIEISDEQTAVPIDETRLRWAVEMILADAGIHRPEIKETHRFASQLGQFGGCLSV